MRFIAIADGCAGSYGLSFPDLPGCVAMGRTMDEAFVVASEALGDCIGTLEAAGRVVPKERTSEALRNDLDVANALNEGAYLVSVRPIRVVRKMRINVSLDGGVMSAIDEVAKRRGLTRSSMVEIISHQGLG